MANQTPVLTRHLPFFPCGSADLELFSVQGNVPAADALVYASSLLESVIGLLKDNENWSSKDSACMVMIEMAKAVVDAVEVGRA